MSPSAMTIFVCVSCRSSDQETAAGGPGLELVDALREKFAAASADGVDVRPVECLAVCKRPATIALVGAGKWTYLVGDLTEGAHLDEIVEAALSYQRSDNGIVPWKERPASFRKGVVARIPPLGFDMQDQQRT
jgi:predicted metal-binding protein